MKAKLREVDLVFHIPIRGGSGDWRQVIVQVGLLQGKLDVTFTMPSAEDGEPVPADVIEGIQQAVDWAKKNVRAKDLVEMDAEGREAD